MGLKSDTNLSWQCHVNDLCSLSNKKLDWCAESKARRTCLAHKVHHKNVPISRTSHVNEVRCAPLHDT